MPYSSLRLFSASPFLTPVALTIYIHVVMTLKSAMPQAFLPSQH